MARRTNAGIILCFVIVSIIVISAPTVNALTYVVEQQRIDTAPIAYPESGAKSSDAGSSQPIGSSRSPGIQIGDTKYEYQHDGSMGRQIAFTFEGTHMFAGVHFVWTCQPCDGCYPVYRHMRYNAVDITGTWAWGIGFCAGRPAEYENGGYVSLDVTHYGAAVPSFHHGLVPDQYRAYTYYCINPPLAFWVGEFNPGPSESSPPPNCDAIMTGNEEMLSQYVWPQVEFDVCGIDSVVHKVCTEKPPSGFPAGEIQSLIYYRDMLGGDDFQVTPPPCGKFIDSVYNVTAVVRQNPVSEEIAVVWGHPIHYQDDPDDPCGALQWQNDVYVWKSPDCGVTWDDGMKMNITDYTHGGTIPIDQVPELFYTDLSAVYDHSGTLHVVWNTPLRDGCWPMYASRIWHWDDLNNCISLVYDASTPRVHCNTGGFNVSTAKMNISECFAAGIPRMYVQFTRFGAHTSTDGDTSIDCSIGDYANGDIFLVGSNDGGLTWGPDPDLPPYAGPGAQQGEAVQLGNAVNLTNTFTPDCPPGDCESEHWSSMAKYSVDSVLIQYIEDKDAGGSPLGEGAVTCNPVKYITHPCFEPAPVCQLAYTPSEIGYPTFIAPDGEPNCTGDYTSTFDLTITNSGNMPADYDVLSNAVWLSYFGGDPMAGVIPAGCDNQVTITMQIGPIPPPEGVYETALDIYGCGGALIGAIDVQVHVFCDFFVPEYRMLATAAWSVGVWNAGRAGTGSSENPQGNMYWYAPEYEFSMMWDAGTIITYADDVSQTWFSVFDGSISGNSLVPLSPIYTSTYPNYEYAHTVWATGDTGIVGSTEYFIPLHPDTVALIQRVTVCNATETPKTIHIGEAVDWDIPNNEGVADADGSGFDIDRKMIYQYNAAQDNHCAGISFSDLLPDDTVFGAIVLENDLSVYVEHGYDPAAIGALLAGHSGFEITDSLEDLNTIYVVRQNLELPPGEGIAYTMVKASSVEGIGSSRNPSTGSLTDYVDRGMEWIDSMTVPDSVPADGSVFHNIDGYEPCDANDTLMGSRWLKLRPTYGPPFEEFEVIDTVDNTLSAGDSVKLQNVTTRDSIFWHTVERVTTTVRVKKWLSNDSLYLDLIDPPNPGNDSITVPTNTWWWEVYPFDEHVYVCVGWWDNDANSYLSVGDGLVLWRLYPSWCYLYEVMSMGTDIVPPFDTGEDSCDCFPGDANGSDNVDIDDVVYLIAYIFGGGAPPTPYAICSGDPNCSCNVDIDDVVYLIAYIFSGGPPPCTCQQWVNACGWPLRR